MLMRCSLPRSVMGPTHVAGGCSERGGSRPLSRVNCVTWARRIEHRPLRIDQLLITSYNQTREVAIVLLVGERVGLHYREPLAHPRFLETYSTIAPAVWTFSTTICRSHRRFRSSPETMGARASAARRSLLATDCPR